MKLIMAKITLAVSKIQQHKYHEAADILTVAAKLLRQQVEPVTEKRTARR